MGNICNCDKSENSVAQENRKRPTALRFNMDPHQLEVENRFADPDTALRRRSKNTIAVQKLLSYKNLRGFKSVDDIKKIYRWKKELGAGQFGSVHEAIHLLSESRCAIKVIHKSKVAQAAIYQKLLKQELAVCEKLDHPHIVRVLDLCEDDEDIFIAMEIVEHGNLMEALSNIKRNKIKFTEKDAATIA